MNRCGIAFALLLVLLIPPKAGAQEGDLAEAKRLNGEIRQRYATGQYQEAIPLAERALEINEKERGPEHPDTAQSLNNLAALYQAGGAYAKAEPLYQRALAIAEKVLGPNDPNTATALNNLATLYRITGAYSKAEPLYLRALTIRESVLGPKHPDTASALNNLATLYQTTGTYAKAEPLYKRALAIREKALGTEHPNTAVSLNNLAELYRATGAYEKAEPLYKRALAIREKTLGPEHPNTAVSLNNLAELYRATGAYEMAEPLYKRALAIREKTLGPDHHDTAISLDSLAQFYLTVGAYNKAEPLFERALTITEKAFGPEHPDTAGSLNNMGAMYQTIGAYTKAEPLYLRALAIAEKALGPEHPNTATTLNILASLYQDTGAYAKAEPLLQRALAIREKVLGPEHPDIAVSLDGLARYYLATGVYTKAEPLYQHSLAIREKALAAGHPDIAHSLDNLAALYQTTGAYSKAEPLYKRALKIIEKAAGPNHPNTAAALNDLAVLYQTTGAYKQAQRLFERALTVYERTLAPEHPNIAATLNNFAALYIAAGVPTRALPFYQRALAIDEINVGRFMLSSNESRKRAYLSQRVGDTYADASFSLMVVDPRARAIGLTAVLQYKGRVLDAMADSVALLRRSVDPKDEGLFDDLTAVAQQLSTLAFRGPGNLSTQAYRERLNSLSREQERLESELSTRSAAFRQAVTPITLDGVRQRLPNDAALVEWFRYQPFDPKANDEKARRSAARYVAYVLRHDGDPVAIDLGAAHDIDKLAKDFRVALTDKAQDSYKKGAHELFEKIIKPLQSALSGINRLLLSPDSELNLLPFASLMDDHGDYLTQRFEITYLTSGRDLLTLAASTPAYSSPVVMANPDYGQSFSGPPANLASYRSVDLDRGGLVFPPLTGTAEEAKALQGLLKLDAQEVLTETNATEEKLKGLHSPRILHVATHGFFLNDQQVATGALRPVSFGSETSPQLFGENPLLRSGLALAGANARRSGESDDGILTAAEAAQLDLRGTQLVVLSACETGLGQVQQGEGVYGLRRALVLAGAQAQLVSLWKVADTQTRTLMVDYYKRLLDGEGRSAALREVQKAMIANPATQHPYYWAAFLPIGNWTPLAGKE